MHSRAPLLPRLIGALLVLLAVLCSGSTVAAQTADDARDLALVADAKAKGDARAAAIRAYMARAKAAGRCADAARELDGIILAADYPAWLRRVGAEAVATCGDEATAKYLAANILRGGVRERLHALRAARGHAQQPVLDAALKTLGDKEPRLRCEAAELLERHRHVPAAQRLADIAAKGKDRELLEPALRAATTLRRGSGEWNAWERQLEDWAAGEDALRRRAAVAALLADDDARRLATAKAALAADDWSVRALAVEWLRRNPVRASMDALVERLALEAPGTRLSGDLDNALDALSGLAHFDTAEEWALWWRNNADGWRPPAAAGAPATAPPPSKPRLGTGHSAAVFYGIEVESRRAIYIVDLSGSMNEPSKSAGTEGRTRIDVAKDELLQLVDGMPPGSWFNIVGFADGVHPWLDALADCAPDKKSRGAPATGELSAKAKKRDEELRAAAREHVRKLATGGSTNIYDAFARAFEDPDVDTICFLTDGTPTIGTETEAVAIREELQRWNRSRRVRIHCIAVGEDNTLPKWIAADHGGVHRFVP